MTLKWREHTWEDVLRLSVNSPIMTACLYHCTSENPISPSGQRIPWPKEKVLIELVVFLEAERTRLQNAVSHHLLNCPKGWTPGLLDAPFLPEGSQSDGNE